MPNINIDWYSVKDPHPAALPNLNKLVDYMVNNHFTNNLNTVTPYKLAKDLGRHQKQIGLLIADRPGFVQVTRNGKTQGYYWDTVFGSSYPQTFVGHRGRPLIAVEALEDINKEAAITLAKENGKQLKEAAKDLVKEQRNIGKPDIKFPVYGSGELKRATLSAEFSLLPKEVALDLIQTSAKPLAEGNFSEELLADMATALFSLLTSAKETNDA